MRILIVGSGGREHAIAWALAKDADVVKVFAWPGNPGISQVATCLPGSIGDLAGILAAAEEHRIDLVVVGPEVPLTLGIADICIGKNIPVFGPTAAAARLESSKTFCKTLCQQYDIPTARWVSCNNVHDAMSALRTFSSPWVIKMDGLAAGKGVTVASTELEARNALTRIFERGPGPVVVEEFLRGWELTVMATVAGENVCWHAPSFQDSKRVGDNDTGPNTGGMGVFGPVPGMTLELRRTIEERILRPLAAALARLGTPFYGLMSPNLMISEDGKVPYLLECNSRFGDPETQVLMPMVKSGLARHLHQIGRRMRAEASPVLKASTEWSAGVNVVVASAGYPTSPALGVPIDLVEPLPASAILFHAGTGFSPDGTLVTAGGRVFNAVAHAPSVEQARRVAYQVASENVVFEGKMFRGDIGLLGYSVERPSPQ